MPGLLIYSMEIIISLIYTVAAVIVFALFDYFGFNVSLKRGWADFSNFNKYRVVQGLFQLILTVLLFYFSGWRAAIAFNIIWWTWGCDFLFYLYCEVFNYGNDRGNFRKEVKSNSVKWAWWTPYGLLFTKKGDVIKYRKLVWQAVLGTLGAVVVLLI